ncbi:MAG: acetate kinase [Bacteroidaceae bacterium]
MKILVLNCGSSSIKYKLYNMDNGCVMASGGLEKVGQEDSFLKYTTKNGEAKRLETPILSHDKGVELVFRILTDPQDGALKSLHELGAVGHRIVHGGTFTESELLTPEVLEKWKTYSDLAPLHNPAHLKGIEAVSKQLPTLPQVGVFDTAFHQTMPDHAYMYALPYELYEKYGVRRYGFHGTSHRFVTQRVGEFLNVDVTTQRIITCHIGNGASVAAIDHGKCVDTSMGLTPLEGLIMGTRSGDIDPYAILFLMDKMGLSTAEASNLLNKESGMKGISGIGSDMREIEQAMIAGNQRAILATKMYVYRIKKYIGAYAAAMGGVDIIVFTAGVGEHQYDVRSGALDGLDFLGVTLDKEVNQRNHGAEEVLSTPNSRVTVAVIPTDEEKLVAQDTLKLVK